MERVGLKPSDVVGVEVLIACRTCQGRGNVTAVPNALAQGIGIARNETDCPRCEGRKLEAVPVSLGELRDLLARS